jgi:TLD
MVTSYRWLSMCSFLWRRKKHHEQDHVEVFKWTGKNDYVALCEAAFISFGGGYVSIVLSLSLVSHILVLSEGKYGLYLDGNLIDGSSAPCPTFENHVLCSSSEFDENKTVSFECVGVEAWGVTA